MPRVKRKGARGNIRPLKSWFQTDLQKARKKNPEFYLADFYYVRMLERNILTIKGKTFGLHHCILSKPDTDTLPLEKGNIFAYLLVEALRKYAKSEWDWLNQEPGQFSRELRQIAQQLQGWQTVWFEDDGRLAKTLQDAAARAEKQWTEGNAIEQAFLYARRRLIRDIRLRVGAIIPLSARNNSALTNRLCANLFSAFSIKTHPDQGYQQLLRLVWKDRQRHDASFGGWDDMLRQTLQHTMSILQHYIHGNVAFHPFPASQPALPSFRISPLPQELVQNYSSLPYLSPSDYNPPDLLNRY